MNFLPGQLFVSEARASFTTRDGMSVSLQGCEASSSLNQGGEAILEVRPEHIHIYRTDLQYDGSRNRRD